MKVNMMPLNDYQMISPSEGVEDVNEFGLVYQEDTSKNALRSGVIVSGSSNLEGQVAFYPSDKFYTMSRGGTQYHMVKKADVVAVSLSVTLS